MKKLTDAQIQMLDRIRSGLNVYLSGHGYSVFGRLEAMDLVVRKPAAYVELRTLRLVGAQLTPAGEAAWQAWNTPNPLRNP